MMSVRTPQMGQVVGWSVMSWKCIGDDCKSIQIQLLDKNYLQLFAKNYLYIWYKQKSRPRSVGRALIFLL